MAGEIMLSDLRRHGDVTLVIRLESNAPSNYLLKWDDLARDIHEWSTTDKTKIALGIVNRCQVASNKSRTLLNRAEFGLGGSTGMNAKDKQLRLLEQYRYSPTNDIINSIMFAPIDSDDGTERWTIAELTDLVSALRDELDDSFIKSNGGLMGYLRIEPLS